MYKGKNAENEISNNVSIAHNMIFWIDDIKEFNEDEMLQQTRLLIAHIKAVNILRKMEAPIHKRNFKMKR